MRRAKLFLMRSVLTMCVVAANSAVMKAQSLADVPPGNRVQLVLRDSLRQGPISPALQYVMGQFVRATTDSIWLRPIGASEFSVSRRAIKRARVSGGVSRVQSAIAFGVGLGASAALAVNLARTRQPYHRGQDVIVGGAIGFGAGALVGALSPFEHWRRLRL